MKVKVWLRQVRINRQGYSDRGDYYGVGQPLYLAQWDDGEEFHYDYIRAANRADAKEKVRDKIEGATFYR
jgi:hypothetical protein